MAEQERPDAITVVGPVELYTALAAGVTQLLGHPMPRESVLVLLAHVHLETAGGKAIHCFNLGNIKHVGGDGRDYCRFRASEVLDGKEQFFTMAFRAYGTLDDAVADYLHEIHGQFGYAWPAVENANPEDFAVRLRAKGYYTANVGLYQKGMRARYDLCARIIPAEPDTNVETVDAEIAREVEDGKVGS